MVLAEIGRAVRADAVLLDADAIDVEAADDRPAGRAGREARAGDAGLGEQQIAERAPPLRWISSFGTTVTVANWSVTIGKRPDQRGGGWRGRDGDGSAGRAGWRARGTARSAAR